MSQVGLTLNEALPGRGAVAHVRETIDFLGINVDVVDTSALFERIAAFVDEARPRMVTYLNAHCTVVAMRTEWYRRLLNEYDLVYPDGQSVVWASRFLGTPLPCRSTGADFMPAFCARFAERGDRLFFLGAKPGIAEKARLELEKGQPGLKIVGTHHGYFRPEESDDVITLINAAEPDIVIVGMGVPYQEQWIRTNRGALKAPVVWGIGALFNFISGDVARGPRILVDNGFEWLCRLCVEPRRLWRRFIFGNARFLSYVVRHRLARRNSRPA